MGMDVIGRNPDSDVGEYFRANIWSWRPIHQLIFELCADLFDEETLLAMATNGGAGAYDQETCIKMAIRFENWMEQNTAGYTMESNVRVDAEGEFLSDEEANDPEKESFSPYEVEDEHMKEWIEFLRHCGGFEVR